MELSAASEIGRQGQGGGCCRGVSCTAARRRRRDLIAPSGEDVKSLKLIFMRCGADQRCRHDDLHKSVVRHRPGLNKPLASATPERRSKGKRRRTRSAGIADRLFV